MVQGHCEPNSGMSWDPVGGQRPQSSPALAELPSQLPAGTGFSEGFLGSRLLWAHTRGRGGRGKGVRAERLLLVVVGEEVYGGRGYFLVSGG